MNRRSFTAAGLAVAGGISLPRTAGGTGAPAARRGEPFTLDYAPHFGMFSAHAGPDLADQLRFMADEGFRSMEDNDLMGRPVADQERIGRTLRELGMRMGVFVANPATAFGAPTFTSGDPKARETFLAELRQAVETAPRVGARWATVVLGEADRRLDPGYQTSRVIDQLRAGAEIVEPHGLVLVLEPLNTRRNHPGMFLTHIAQAHAICRAVNSPSVKILYDVYHQQITEGNLIPSFDLAWDEIGYVQVGDNPGRREPGTGEIHFGNLFAHLHRRGWQGIIGMEHGSSRPGREGERAVIDAYRAVDPR